MSSSANPPAPFEALGRRTGNTRRTAIARRTLARHRRWVAAVFAAAATGFALLVLRPPEPATTRILTAARDLPAGTVLRARDLRTVWLPADLVPAGGIGPRPEPPVTGRTLSGPMRRGEPLTDARLLSSGMLRGYGDGIVATPIRVADAGVARLLRPGDRVDVLLAGDHLDDSSGADPAADDLPANLSAAGRVRLLATAVPVITVPRSGLDAGEGALIVLATDRRQATVLAGTRGLISITVVSGSAAPP